MRNLIILSKNEEIIKEFKTNKLRVVITAKRLIIEDRNMSFSIRLDIIGVVHLIKRRGRKYDLVLYSKSGKDLFPLLKNCRIDFLTREDVALFENTLSSVILQY